MAFCTDPLRRGCMNATITDAPCNLCYHDLQLARERRKEAVEALPPKQRRAYDVLEARGDWMPGADVRKAIETDQRGAGNVLNRLLLDKDLVQLRKPEGVEFCGTLEYEWRVKPL